MNPGELLRPASAAQSTVLLGPPAVRFQPWPRVSITRWAYPAWAQVVVECGKPRPPE